MLSCYPVNNEFNFIGIFNLYNLFMGFRVTMIYRDGEDGAKLFSSGVRSLDGFIRMISDSLIGLSLGIAVGQPCREKPWQYVKNLEKTSGKPSGKRRANLGKSGEKLGGKLEENLERSRKTLKHWHKLSSAQKALSISLCWPHFPIELFWDFVVLFLYWNYSGPNELFSYLAWIIWVPLSTFEPLNKLLKSNFCTEIIITHNPFIRDILDYFLHWKLLRSHVLDTQTLRKMYFFGLPTINTENHWGPWLVKVP